MKSKSLIVFTILFFLSCNKQDTAVLIVGDNSNMTLISYESVTEEEEPLVKGNKVDLNGDGVFDLDFYFSNSGTNGTGYYSDSYLSCLHTDVEIYGFNSNDTIFHYLDTIINNYGEIHVNYRDVTSCARNSMSDSIVSITTNNSHPYDLTENDIISKEGNFFSYGFKLTSNAYYNPMVNAVTDTLYSWSKKRISNCYAFSGGIGYLGFRIRKKAKKNYKYGWLKYNLGSSSVSFIESAIEK